MHGHIDVYHDAVVVGQVPVLALMVWGVPLHPVCVPGGQLLAGEDVVDASVVSEVTGGPDVLAGICVPVVDVVLQGLALRCVVSDGVVEVARDDRRVAAAVLLGRLAKGPRSDPPGPLR